MNEKERLNTDDIARSNERRPEEYVATGGAGAARVRDPQQPVRDAQHPAHVQDVGQERHAALFPEKEAGDLRSRWESIQTGFVDEPRKAVEQADQLVAQAMKRLAEVFSEERRKLEGHWDRGDNVSTEDLRVALQRYRSFFGRLLSI